MNDSGPRSFRLYREPPPFVPEFEAADLAEPKRAEIRRQFAPQAVAARHRETVVGRVLLGWIGVVVGLGLLTPWLPGWRLDWLGFCGFGGLWLILMGMIVLGSPRLRCPGCLNRPDRQGGQYCPDCGSRPLVWDAFGLRECCPGCRKVIGRRGDRHRLRFCQFCGVLLDEAGL